MAAVWPEDGQIGIGVRLTSASVSGLQGATSYPEGCSGCSPKLLTRSERVFRLIPLVASRGWGGAFAGLLDWQLT